MFAPITNYLLDFSTNLQSSNVSTPIVSFSQTKNSEEDRQFVEFSTHYFIIVTLFFMMSGLYMMYSNRLRAVRNFDDDNDMKANFAKKLASISFPPVRAKKDPFLSKLTKKDDSAKVQSNIRERTNVKDAQIVNQELTITVQDVNEGEEDKQEQHIKYENQEKQANESEETDEEDLDVSDIYVSIGGTSYFKRYDFQYFGVCHVDKFILSLESASLSLYIYSFLETEMFNTTQTGAFHRQKFQSRRCRC